MSYTHCRVGRKNHAGVDWWVSHAVQKLPLYGNVAQSSSDFGYMTIGNYFETSHAKGPQDGAGANLKHKADMGVIKRQVYICMLVKS